MSRVRAVVFVTEDGMDSACTALVQMGAEIVDMILDAGVIRCLLDRDTMGDVSVMRGVEMVAPERHVSRALSGLRGAHPR